jgi:hypothetical protein
MDDRDKKHQRPADEAPEDEPSKGQYGGLEGGLGYGGGRDIKDVLDPDENPEDERTPAPER